MAHEQGCVVRIKPGAFTVFPDNLFDEQYLTSISTPGLTGSAAIAGAARPIGKCRKPEIAATAGGVFRPHGFGDPHSGRLTGSH